MAEQLRINFFGAPARGKSNMASWIYSQLRFQHYNAEYVQEWIKLWAYRKYQMKPFDQIYVFGKQQHLEYEMLKAGVKNIVTDSPLWLSVFYAPIQLKRGLAELIREYEMVYPALNILVLKDQGAPYEREGRYQDQDGAQELEDKLVRFMPEVLGYGNFQVYNFSQQEEIKNAVLRAAIK
jgi:hypothetical protein